MQIPGGAGYFVKAVGADGKPLNPAHSFEPLLAHIPFDVWCGPSLTATNHKISLLRLLGLNEWTPL